MEFIAQITFQTDKLLEVFLNRHFEKPIPSERLRPRRLMCDAAFQISYKPFPVFLHVVMSE